MLKKFAVLFALIALSNLSFAGGCWVNGKYVQCVKNADGAGQDSSLQR